MNKNAVQVLTWAVIAQTICDLKSKNKTQAREALQFINSDDFTDWAAIVDINPQVIRDNIAHVRRVKHSYSFMAGS